jgi:two-component system, OmpR family, sensor histidine kinase MtrB
MALTGIPGGGSSARLHAVTRRSVWALAALVAVACTALVVLTTISRQSARHVVELNDMLRAVDNVRIALSKLGRQAGLAYITQNPDYARERDHGEEELFASMAKARSIVRDPRQQQLLAQADAQIRHYLDVRKAAEARHAPNEEVMLTSQPAIQMALETLYEASRRGFEEVAMAERRMAQSEMIENILGIVIGASLLVGFVVTALMLRRLVLAPLLGLGSAIDRFAAGDRSARVVAGGTPEVQQTAESFNEMASSLERQHRGMLTFVAGVAHDLRNPLAAMRMGLKLLDAPVPEPNKRKTVEVIDRQITLLERMVGDFLDAARIESGHLELQLRRHDLRELAQEAVQLYAVSSRIHRLVYAPADMPVEVRVDDERIAQVLNNLVSNAIKYSPQGGDVRVFVTSRDGEAIVAVQDSGIGIAPEDQKHIFEPFRRTGASRETAPGVGLGLSVARQIIEAHGGRIAVESTPGVGSIFRVYLPLAGLAPQYAPAPAPL